MNKLRSSAVSHTCRLARSQAQHYPKQQIARLSILYPISFRDRFHSANARPHQSPDTRLMMIPPKRCMSAAAETQQQKLSEIDVSSEEKPVPQGDYIVFAESAAKQLDAINRRKGLSQALRVTVESGGCHGFQYKFELTDEVEEDDIIFEREGARVIVDPGSLELISGSTVDYVEELIGSSFQVIGNPKAETSCGCKTSFNVKI
ncbi:hypothetical protein BC832DRAFT_560666 [Gaertneriomyces semiglobifer]|nr:hypothetical protein BC832DRAFT_560666 [Gaertneriomyces semiglobifer]